MESYYSHLSRALESESHNDVSPTIDCAASVFCMDADAEYLRSVAEDAGFEESSHPREAKGGKGGGRFTKKPETLAKEDSVDNLEKGGAGVPVPSPRPQTSKGAGASERIADALKEAEKQGSKRVGAVIEGMKKEYGGGNQKLLDAVFDRLNACNEDYFWALRKAEGANARRLKNILDTYYESAENIGSNRGVSVSKNTANEGDDRREARAATFREANS